MSNPDDKKTSKPNQRPTSFQPEIPPIVEHQVLLQYSLAPDQKQDVVSDGAHRPVKREKSKDVPMWFYSDDNPKPQTEEQNSRLPSDRVCDK